MSKRTDRPRVNRALRDAPTAVSHHTGYARDQQPRGRCDPQPRQRPSARGPRLRSMRCPCSQRPRHDATDLRAGSRYSPAGGCGPTPICSRCPPTGLLALRREFLYCLWDGQWCASSTWRWPAGATAVRPIRHDDIGLRLGPAPLTTSTRPKVFGPGSSTNGAGRREATTSRRRRRSFAALERYARSAPRKDVATALRLRRSGSPHSCSRPLNVSRPRALHVMHATARGNRSARYQRMTPALPTRVAR